MTEPRPVPSTPPPGYRPTSRHCTPDWGVLDGVTAEGLIALGGNFREPRLDKIAQYFAEMKAGRWAWEMLPIAMVSTENHLIDGMHRLRAYLRYLAEGGTPQYVEVRYGCPPEWAFLLDAGRVRTTNQRVKATGATGTHLIAAGLAGLWYVARAGSLRHVDLPASLVDTVLGRTEGTPARAILEAAARGQRRVYGHLSGEVARGWGSQPVTAALALMFHQDADRAAGFVQALAEAADFAPSKNSMGAAAALDLCRSSTHLGDPDPGRYDIRGRVFAALMMAWDDPKVSLSALQQRLTSRDRATMHAKLGETFAKYGDAWRNDARRLLLDAGVDVGLTS